MFWYSTVSVFARIMGAIMTGVALLGAIMIGVPFLFLLTFLPYFEGASNFGYIRSMLAVERVVSTAVRDTIPTKIGWKDLTRWIIIAVASTLSSWCDALSTRAHNWEEYHRHKKNVDAMREQMHLSENEQLKTAKKGHREQLLEQFAQTKKKLDEMGGDLAFLALGVVDG